MKYFVSCTRDSKSCYVSYEGMNQDTINALLTELGATNIQYITEDAWNTVVAALQK